MNEIGFWSTEESKNAELYYQGDVYLFDKYRSTDLVITTNLDIFMFTYGVNSDDGYPYLTYIGKAEEIEYQVLNKMCEVAIYKLNNGKFYWEN
jgi:hypothetical protein